MLISIIGLFSTVSDRQEAAFPEKERPLTQLFIRNRYYLIATVLVVDLL